MEQVSGSRLVLAGEPNERQKEFFEATARYIGYGGARGGGKSWAMRRKFVMLALNYDGLRLLLLRRTVNELNENHVVPLLAELGTFVLYNSAQKVIKFPNGSRIKLGYCDREVDIYQYQGQEYDVIGLEEATQFTEAQMQYITTCNRSTRSDFKPRMYFTMNPGGVGHDWVKRLFIDRRYRNAERAEDYVFIPARVTDNTVLMERNPEYIQVLKNLPEHLRRAHLEGDWDAMEGQYFEEFDRKIHVVPKFQIPLWWKRFRAMDWGYRDPCCVLWFAVAPDGRIYVYDEIYITKTVASTLAGMVVAKSRGQKISYTAASPDAWAKRGATDGVEGESVADVFAKSGVALLKADNSRIIGWQRVRECLQRVTGADGDERPMLQIFENCRNLIRTLPILTYDPNDKEDVSDRCEDHAAEALRYGLMSRARTKPPSTRRKEKPVYDPFAQAKKDNTNSWLFS